jgi:alkyl hydroperoxide reductase subunit AhpC
VSDETINPEELVSLQLGDDAPNFTAYTTAGPIDFYLFKRNKWAVLFSHPKDFTPVCTTELGVVSSLAPEFASRDTKVIGLSVDSLESHQAWARDIAEVTGHPVNFPMIADEDRAVSRLYGMIHPNASDTMTVRSVFVISPDNKIKLILTYPASTGRNFQELLRSIDSLQLTARHSVATPANWQYGQDVIITTGVSDADAGVRFPGYRAVKPYLRVTAQPGT